MAFIDDIYVHVTSETVSRNVAVSKHPVESGFDITDSIRPEPAALKLKGEIVPSAPQGSQSRFNIILAALREKQRGAALITYKGSMTFKNAVIESFDTSFSGAVAGGCNFTMTIREIRIADPAFVTKATSNKTTKLGTQQVQKNTAQTYHIVQSGDSLWSIAVKYYGDGSKFTAIRDANKSVISKHGNNPNMIWPGDRLLIPRL